MTKLISTLLALLLTAPAGLGHVCIAFSKENSVKLKGTILTGVSFKAEVHIQVWTQATSDDGKHSNETTETHKIQVTMLDVGADQDIATKTISFPLNQVIATTLELPFRIDVSGLQNFEFRLIQQNRCDIPEQYRIHKRSIRTVPAPLSILPPLVTLIVAVITRHVLAALFSGIFTGSILLYDYNPILSLARTLDTLIPEALTDKDHVVVVMFSFMLSGMVALVGKSGGAEGLAKVVLKWVKTRKHATFATCCVGLLIFFDDYANTLIMGSTVLPIIDKLHVSHQKLAFLIDCIAAPIASIAPISSWIGFELSLIHDEFQNIGLNENVYTAFLQTIPYRFYPILMLSFVFILIFTGREFGPMYSADVKALQESEISEDENGNPLPKPLENELLKPKDGVPLRWYNALIPFVVLVLGTFLGLIVDGYVAVKDNDEGSRGIQDIFKAANSFHVLMWSGALAFLVPMLLYWIQGIMSPQESTTLWIDGMKPLMEPILILVLAWTLGAVVKKTSLSFWLVESLEGILTKEIFPAVVFVFCGLISFCTGSSWSTMTIMFPIVVPLGYSIGEKNYDALIQSISGVLAGSVFGDHCSPISDTTVLSALSARCALNEHVKTQLPYALVVGIVSVLLGFLPSGAWTWYSWYLGIPLGILTLLGIVFVLGKKVSSLNSAPSTNVYLVGQDVLDSSRL